ncbi:unnamed protein product, partial [Ectocarpus sp. 6 AP-2014]
KLWFPRAFVFSIVKILVVQATILIFQCIGLKRLEKCPASSRFFSTLTPKYFNTSFRKGHYLERGCMRIQQRGPSAKNGRFKMFRYNYNRLFLLLSTGGVENHSLADDHTYII